MTYLNQFEAASVSSLPLVRLLFRWISKHDLHFHAVYHFAMKGCHGVICMLSVRILNVANVPAWHQVHLHQRAKTTAERKYVPTCSVNYWKANRIQSTKELY